VRGRAHKAGRALGDTMIDDEADQPALLERSFQLIAVAIPVLGHLGDDDAELVVGSDGGLNIAGLHAAADGFYVLRVGLGLWPEDGPRLLPEEALLSGLGSFGFLVKDGGGGQGVWFGLTGHGCYHPAG